MTSPVSAKARLVVVTVLGVAIAVGVSACGKMGQLEQAPPMIGKDAKSSYSVSKNSGGGDTATLDDTSSSKETERAKPDINDVNKQKDPYRGNKSVADAPLEGFGNATSFNNNTPK